MTASQNLRSRCLAGLIAAALWAIPNSARAQLYVAQTVFNPNPTGIVGEYDASSGAPIWVDNLSRGFPGFFSSGLAVSGNTLFVADEGQPSQPGRVGEYDATTGAAIKASFITGLSAPRGIVESGNTLFVVNYSPNMVGAGRVSTYNASTGSVINADFITALSEPTNLALEGNTLFVEDPNRGTVGAYNATTGAAINANFLSGLNEPFGLAVSPVPEASTWSMMAGCGAALCAVGLYRRRARASA